MVLLCYIAFFLFKQKTPYDMRISDWSSDVCSSDLLRVALRPPRDFIARAFTAETERAAVGQRKKVRVRPLDHAQAVLGQAQVGDHARVEQADGVAGDGVAEAGEELLGHRRAADDTPTFEHADLEAGGCEIRRTDQAVEIGRAHVCTPVTNAHLVCRL